MLPDALRERGAEVDVLALYETVAEPLDDDARAAAVARRLRHVHLRLDRALLRSRRRARTRSTARGSPRSAPPRAPSCAPTAASPTSRPTRTLPTGWSTRCWPTREARHMPRPITFLSDYGLADEFVGVVHAVIAHDRPDARVIDLSHGVPRQDVLAGALMLARAAALRAARRAPRGRRPRGRRARGAPSRCAPRSTTALLVGPDNGLLLPGRRALRRGRRGGRDLDARRGGSSRSPPRSTAATCSRPSPRGSPPARRWPTPATPLDPDELVAARAPAPRAARARARSSRTRW